MQNGNATNCTAPPAHSAPFSFWLDFVWKSIPRLWGQTPAPPGKVTWSSQPMVPPTLLVFLVFSVGSHPHALPHDFPVVFLGGTHLLSDLELVFLYLLYTTRGGLFSLSFEGFIPIPAHPHHPPISNWHV